jgi:uncharacterized protein with PIN domain
MNQANFRLLDDLDFFLRPSLRGQDVTLTFGEDQSVKHLIESLGVPHTEIGEIRVDGKPVGMGYLVQDGEQVEVRYTAPQQLPEQPRFVLDGHLGRLASHLRMLGLDSLYNSDYADDELVEISVQEERILLSRDRRLLMHKVILHGYCLRSLKSDEQIREVVRRYNLQDWIKPFSRCMRCNHPLEPVSKEQVLDRLEPLTKLYFEEFHICPACNQVYWKGSHVERMLELVEELR